MEMLEFLNDQRLQLRNDGNTLTGYAAVWYQEGNPATQYQPFPEHIERITRGAFREVIARGDEVLAIVNHEEHAVLGRRSANTLRLDEDDIGLRYSVDLPETTLARDTRASVSHGNFGGSSIGFLRGKTDRTMEGDASVATIREVKLLHHLGPVIEPAFKGTNVAMRCRQHLLAEYLKDQEAARNARIAEIEEQLAALT